MLKIHIIGFENSYFSASMGVEGMRLSEKPRHEV